MDDVLWSTQHGQPEINLPMEVAFVQITINTLLYSALKQIFALYSIVTPGPGANLQLLGSESRELHSEVVRACLMKPECGGMPLSRNEQLASRKR